MQKLFIPDTICIGYQERENTYTGKLAYIVYKDHKGVLRKETSWRNWSSHIIGDITNTPTSGFVLNKGVGGTRESYGWNPRNEYIRVYDPRGFEIEISVANLLFILQECTSTKGKGLEGEFVYSWSGTELVLLPTSCEDYKKCREYTKDQSKKVTKSDVSVGDWVRFKDGEEYIYLGRHECCQDFFAQNYGNTDMKKQHVYYNPNKDYSPYRYETGFTKLASVLDRNNNFAEYVEEFITSWHCNKVVDIEFYDIEAPNDDDIMSSWGNHLVRCPKGEVFFARFANTFSRYYHYNSYNATRRFLIKTPEDYKQKSYHSILIISLEKDSVENYTFLKPIFITENNLKYTEKGESYDY